MATVRRLLKRHVWSWRAAARKALERDDHAVELCKKEVWILPSFSASRCTRHSAWPCCAGSRGRHLAGRHTQRRPSLLN
ncbi:MULTISPECIES: winged helix-turn-helix domain-containing protein [Streptomyces]|uniref:winged helix-turn-helix domain-containing protein n=1 Tax=Streptomyces TaxID=1883 RepID=UPI001F48CB42|nr:MULTISPECIES: winged helix-turn-helix domain-containing protein [Streptomyces]